MKRLGMIGLFLIAILALGVSAADFTVSTTALSTPDTKPTRDFSVSFNVKDATQNLTGLSISRIGLDDFSINFSINNVPLPLNSFNLNVGEEKTITVRGKIPEDVNTRSSPFSGTITISGTGVPSKTISLSVNAESQLNLDNVKFIVDGSSKSIDEGDTRKDVKPGSKLEIKGDIENIFTDNDDITIEDVTVEITIKDIDDGDDLEESEDVGDIDADEKEGFKVEFEIPEDVDAEEYDVDILVEGEDENGASHFVEWKNVKLKVEKDQHDIVITKTSISPSKISCSRNINVNVDLKNQGKSDEDEVVVRIENADLNIDSEDISIPEIDEGTGDDTEYSKTYTFTVDEKAKAGTYPIMVKVYYDTDELSDSEPIDLVVEDCKVVEEKEEEPEEEVVVITPPKIEKEEEEEEEQPEIITEPVTETTEVSLLQSNTYLMLLIGAVGVAVIVIIIMIIVLFSMKKKV